VISGPLRLSQNLLQHESVDVHHAILEQMQREHTDLVILAAIAGHFAMAGEEDEIVGAVPLLDDVQALGDLVAEGLIVKVPAEEDGFDRPAKFGESLVSRMLNVAPDEAAQNRFGFGRAAVVSPCRKNSSSCFRAASGFGAIADAGPDDQSQNFATDGVEIVLYCLTRHPPPQRVRPETSLKSAASLPKPPDRRNSPARLDKATSYSEKLGISQRDDPTILYALEGKLPGQRPDGSDSAI
jgi:hypothetical protein